MRTGLTPEFVEKLARDSDPDERKRRRKTLRAQALARREALTDAQCEQHSAQICDRIEAQFGALAGRRVGFCWPLRNEADLRPLMQRWLARQTPGFAALLPVVTGRERPLAFRVWTPDGPMTPDEFGIPTPSEGEFVVPEALLIPLNAFDAAGYRLGYGGGFFDRTLAAQNPAPLAIGVGFELARVASIHPEPHDIRLDAIVSEAGVWRFG